MTGVFFRSKKLIDWYVIHFHASVFDAASILCSFNRHAKKAETLIYEFIKTMNEFYIQKSTIRGVLSAWLDRHFFGKWEKNQTRYAFRNKSNLSLCFYIL